jgi:hypothetical protein
MSTGYITIEAAPTYALMKVAEGFFCWSFRAAPKSLSIKGGVFPNFISQTHLLAFHVRKEAHSQSESNEKVTLVHLNKLLASPAVLACSEKGCKYSGFTDIDFQQHQLNAHNCPHLFPNKS